MAFNSYTGVNIPFTADNAKFLQAMREARGSVGALQADMSIGLTKGFSDIDYMQRRLQTGLGRTADAIKNLGASLTTFTMITGAAGAGAMSKYFDMDALSKGLDVITKSKDITQNYLAQFLEDAKKPGVGYEELAQHGTRWLILGDNIGFARKKMLEFGNALALEGKGKSVFDTINFQLIQMANKGKVMAEDLKPILSASTVISKTISDRYNSTDSGDIQKMLEKNGVGAKEFINQLVADLSKLERVAGGAKNSWENFTDSIFIGAAAFGEWLDKGLGVSGIMDQLGDALRSVAMWLKEMDPNTRRWMASALGLTVALGPLLSATGTLLKTMLSFGTLGQVIAGVSSAFKILGATMLANPYSAIAVGILGMVTALGLYNKALSDSEERELEVNKARKFAIATGQAEADSLKSLVKVASDENTSKAQKADAIKKINQISPEYLGNITEENIRTAAVIQQIDKYTKYVIKKAEYEGIANKISESHLKYLETKARDPKGELGFFDNILYSTGKATAIAKRRIDEEAAGYLATENLYRNMLKGISGDYFSSSSAMAPYSSTPKGGGGGNSKPEQLETHLKTLEQQAKETMNTLDDLEKEMRKFDVWLDYLSKIDYTTINATGFDAWAGGNKVTASGGFTPEAISAWGDNMIGKFKVPEIKSNLTDLSDVYRNGLQGIAGGITDGLGQMAEAWVNGTFKWQSAGQYFASMLGDIMTGMGQSFVAIGVAKLAADLLMTSTLGGGALIAIGAGLQVAGGAVKGSAGKRTGQGTLGSVGGYSSPTYSGTGGGSTGGGSQALKIDLNLSGNFRIAGSDLVLAISRQTTLNANR